MEGAHFVKTGKLIKLSEQQCLDCATKNGCSGAYQSDCFEYAEGTNMETEEEYPYSSYASTCWDSYDGPVKVNSYKNVAHNSQDQLLAAIANGPVSVTIDAGGYVFQHYIKGIIEDISCGTGLDHAVTAVGYGDENGSKYYIVKNSWGADWGENGYVRIGMNGDGTGICGIQEMSLFPDTN